MKHEKFFRTHPVFTVEELESHLSSQGGLGERTREALLAYHQKAGRVLRVRRGLYAVIPPDTIPGSFPIDPYLVAARLVHDSVLSHRTALEFHGKSYSVSGSFIYSTSRPLEPVSLLGHVFVGTKFPHALISRGEEHHGVLAVERAGLNLRVSSLERALVEVLDRPDLAGSWEEIWRSLEMVEYLDLDMMIRHLSLLGNATTAARVGFYLEQHRDVLMVEEHHLKALRGMRPNKPHYLDRRRRRLGRLVPEWNLIVPAEVLDRSWGEVP